MKLWKRLREKISYGADPRSLRLRMTLGIAAVSALGLGCVASWISLRMQYILIATHKQTIEYIAARFPHDVEIYTEMVSMSTGMQKAVDNLTDEQTWLWVETEDGEIIARSSGLNPALLTLKNISPIPQVESLDNGYWLMCAGPVMVNGVNQGTMYIAQDITGDQTMFLELVGSLTLATVLGIVTMTVAIAAYIKYSLYPLQSISRVTAKISPEDLHEAHFQLENAPTEVRELAETVSEMLRRLAEAWEHQRQLVSNVSHELRTPLTIVSGYLQSTLRRGDNLTTPQREALEIAQSEAQRTIQLMQDLLDLARADNGNMYFHLEPVSLFPLLTEIVQGTRQYSCREINLDWVDETAKKLVIMVDKNRLKQVLLNLVDNAVKYSSPETPVTIKVWLEKDLAKIEISDRGIGIPLAQQTRIFERFYRVDEARCRSTGGTGLGLAIVKSFVEGMKGYITLTSQPGKGSSFTVSFPVL